MYPPIYTCGCMLPCVVGAREQGGAWGRAAWTAVWVGRAAKWVASPCPQHLVHRWWCTLGGGLQGCHHACGAWRWQGCAREGKEEWGEAKESKLAQGCKGSKGGHVGG